MIIGKPASLGIGIGKALIVRDQEIKIDLERSSDPGFEVRLFNEAMEATLTEINELYEQTLSSLGSKEAQIFEAHSLILQDPEFVESIHQEILLKSHKAAFAIDTVSRKFIDLFQAMENEYMRERAIDVKDVSHRLLKKLLNISSSDLNNLSEDTILVAHDVTPSQMVNLDLHHVQGIITEFGGKTSHTAIMARVLNLPAIVGASGITQMIQSGDVLVFCGKRGEVHVNPGPQILQDFMEEKRRIELQRQELENYRELPSVTVDGLKVELEGNISSSLDLKSVLKNGASGIGLFRTEFIYMERNSPPSEEEQFDIYRNILEKMENKPVTIRTLDVGGDKKINYLKIPPEENPALGLRATRYCLKNKSLLKTQLMALLRSSLFGNLRIMFPMITHVEEVIILKKVLSECQTELRKRGELYREDIKIGIMIEVPSAAILADFFAQHVDFFSIGTNDLIQYVCAADRMNDEIQDIYDPLNPAVLRLIHHVLKVGFETKTEVSICGEIAGNEKMTEILIGLGLSKFSMNASSLLEIKKVIRALSFEKSKILAKNILNQSSSTEIKNLLQKENQSDN